MKKQINKKISLLIILVIYLSAIFVGSIVHKVFYKQGLLISVFFANIAATMIVWMFGVLFNNSSVYDPYWSVAPIVIVGYWLISKKTILRITDALIAVSILFWGIRLTVNWVVNWKGMSHEDWRYTKLREEQRDIWQIANLGGINLMPTILVYFGLVPVYYIIFHKSTQNVFMYLGFVIAIISPVIQLIADKQMKDHRQKNTGKYIDTGLWRYSRHPNYFGEICFWWGLFIMQLGTVPNLYISAVGAVLITLLFIFVSIPMMEKHIMDKSICYEEYMEHVSMVVPWVRQ